MIFRRIAACALGMVALAGGAQAADWTGTYAGVHFGYGSGTTDWLLVRNAGNEISGNVGSVVTSNSPDGLLGGVQIGYNRQSGRSVAGLEASFSAANLDGYSTWLNQAGLFRDATTEIDFLGSLALRGGITAGNSLIYAKIGAAIAHGDYVHTGGSAATTRILSGSDTQFGFSLGAGIEHEIRRNVSLKLEYEYMRFPGNDAALTDGNRTALFEHSHDIHTIRVGLNFRFSTR